MFNKFKKSFTKKPNKPINKSCDKQQVFYFDLTEDDKILSTEVEDIPPPLPIKNKASRPIKQPTPPPLPPKMNAFFQSFENYPEIEKKNPYEKFPLDLPSNLQSNENRDLITQTTNSFSSIFNEDKSLAKNNSELNTLSSKMKSSHLNSYELVKLRYYHNLKNHEEDLIKNGKLDKSFGKHTLEKYSICYLEYKRKYNIQDTEIDIILNNS